ncbi:MAG: PKD domain-containing protein [Patescibacteria group bacterium]|nr:PKD domain-containing protein [Patescibacteria group bacterium]
MVTTYYEVLVANFTISTESSLTRELVRFDASSSRIEQRESSFEIGPRGIIEAPGNGIASYCWDFGDGTPPQYSGSPLTSHTYLDDGIYLVTLTVFDHQDRSDSSTKQITILNRPPTAGFVWRHCPILPSRAEQVSPMGIIPVPDPQYVCLELVANSPKQGSYSFDLDGYIVSYQWSYNDLILGYGPVLSRSFMAQQAYSVTLIVTDNDGASSRITREIFVY